MCVQAHCILTKKQGSCALKIDQTFPLTLQVRALVDCDIRAGIS